MAPPHNYSSVRRDENDVERPPPVEGGEGSGAAPGGVRGDEADTPADDGTGAIGDGRDPAAGSSSYGPRSCAAVLAAAVLFVFRIAVLVPAVLAAVLIVSLAVAPTARKNGDGGGADGSGGSHGVAGAGNGAGAPPIAVPTAGEPRPILRPSAPPISEGGDPVPPPTTPTSVSAGATAGLTKPPSTAPAAAPTVPMPSPEAVFWNETWQLDGDGTAWAPFEGGSGDGTIYGPTSTDGYDPRFGTSLAISVDGSVLLVGADLLADGNKTNAGVVYAYSLKKGEELSQKDTFWEPLGWPTAGGRSDPGVVVRGEEFDSLGDSVALSADGKRAIVAASYWSKDWRTDRNYGKIQTFDFDEGTGEWVKTMGDLFGTRQFDNFGGSLALSDDGKILAAGAQQSGPTSRDNPGYVLAFEDSGDAIWRRRGQRLAGLPGDSGGAEGGMGDAFGTDVALSADGSVLAASAMGYKTGHGYAKVYQFSSNDAAENGGVWTDFGPPVTAESISEGESGPGGSFGGFLSLSADGRTLAVGSPQEGKKIWPNGGVSPRNNGAVRLFSYGDGRWTPRGETIKGRSGDTLGTAVALSRDGGVLHVGASQYWKIGLGPGFAVSCSLVNGEWHRRGPPVYGKLRNRESGDSFGKSIAVSADGRVLAAGAFFGNYVSIYSLM